MSRNCYTQSDLIARRSYLTTHCQCCATTGLTGPTGPTGGGFTGNTGPVGATGPALEVVLLNPLTIGYSPVFTTPTQIGYTISTTTANAGIATQTVWQPSFLIFNGLTLDSGVWLINYSCRLATSGVSLLSQYSMWVNGTTGQDAQYGQSMSTNSIQCGPGNGNLFGNGSTVQTYTGASNVVNIAFFGTGTLTGTLSLKAGNNILSATRLA